MAKRPKLPTGYYWRGAIIWCRTDPVEKKEKSTDCKDPKELRQWHAERDRLASDPRYATASKATLGEWCIATLEFKSARSSKETVRFYTQKLGHFRRLWGDDLPMIEIVPNLCDSYVAERRDDGATDHTIVKEFSCLTQILKLARRAGAYPHDIAALKPLDVAPHYVPRERTLSVDEVKMLLKFSSRRLRTFVELTVGLATRLSETLRLQPDDIDLDASEVRIRGTKTEASAGVIPILRPMRSLLEDALPHLPLAVNERGQYVNVRRDLDAACQRAGIERCTPNDLRRTHGTLLKEAGVDNDFIRRMLRHTTTRMVEFVYAKPKAAAIAANIDPHIETLQLEAPSATESATIESWRSRKGCKHRKSLSQLRDLNSGPAVYEAQPGVDEKGQFSAKKAQEHSATTGETQPNSATTATANATVQSASPAAWSLAFAYRAVLARRVA